MRFLVRGTCGLINVVPRGYAYPCSRHPKSQSYGLKIGFMIVGYDFYGFDDKLQSEVHDQVYDDEESEASSRVFDSKDFNGFDSKKSFLGMGIPVLSELNDSNESIIIGHYFLENGNKIKVFSYSLKENKHAKLPSFRFQALALQIKRGRRPEIPKEMPECYATLIRNCWNSDPQKRPTALDIKEKIMKWQSVLGWFPTEESRSDEEAKQFEEADDEKSKEDSRYRAKIYNPPPKPQEQSAEVDDDQDRRELPEIDDELLDDNNDSPDDISKELPDDCKELLNDNKETLNGISKELPDDNDDDYKIPRR